MLHCNSFHICSGLIDLVLPDHDQIRQAGLNFFDVLVRLAHRPGQKLRDTLLNLPRDCQTFWVPKGEPEGMVKCGAILTEDRGRYSQIPTLDYENAGNQDGRILQYGYDLHLLTVHSL